MACAVEAGLRETSPAKKPRDRTIGPVVDESSTGRSRLPFPAVWGNQRQYRRARQDPDGREEPQRLQDDGARVRQAPDIGERRYPAPELDLKFPAHFQGRLRVSVEQDPYPCEGCCRRFITCENECRHLASKSVVVRRRRPLTSQGRNDVVSADRAAVLDHFVDDSVKVGNDVPQASRPTEGDVGRRRPWAEHLRGYQMLELSELGDRHGDTRR